MAIPKLSFSILLFTLFIVFPTHSMEEQNNETAKKFAKYVEKISSAILSEMATSIFNKIADEGTNNEISETLNYTLSMPYDEHETHDKNQKIIANVLMTIQIMKDGLEQFDGQEISYIERLPDEILLLIFYLKIQDIISKNKAVQRLGEFKKFLSAICLMNKRFYKFKNNLEKYFEEQIPPKVSNVMVDLNNYIICFKIGTIYFKSDANDIDDLQFINNIVDPSITEIALKDAGEEIATKAKGPYQLTTIANDILRAEFDKAITEDQRNRIKMLIKPLLVIYKNSPIPTGKIPNYWTSDLTYIYLLKGLYGNNVPNDLL